MKSKIFNFLIYGFGQSINIIGPLLVIPYIISICQEEGLGKIGIAFSVSLILCCIIDYSSGILGTKDVSINRTNTRFLKIKIGEFYAAKTILAIVLTSILVISVFLFPFLKTEKELYLYLIPLLIAQVFNPNWILQGLERFKVIALFNILSKSTYLFLVFTLISKQSDYILVNFFLGISHLILYLIASLYIFYSLGIKYKHISIKRGIRILKKDFTICLSEFCLSIYQFFPIVIIGYFIGNTSAGVYKIIEQIISVFRTYIFMFFSFCFPTICYEIEMDKKNGFKQWMIYNGGNTILIFFGCIFIFIIREYVFLFFKVSPDLIPMLKQLLLIGLLIPVITSISQAFRQLLFALDIMKPYIRTIYIATFFNVILMIGLVQIIGLKGALLTTLIIEGIFISSYSYFIKKYYKLSLTQ